MYDPEFAFKTENALLNDKKLLRSVECRLGVNHPWTQRVALVTDIFHTLSQKENDLINCFDDQKRQDIEDEIDEFLEIARTALNS